METLKQMEGSPKLTSPALTNLVDTLEVIKNFVNQDRFMKKKKFNLHFMEAVRVDNDIAKFSSLNDRLNRCSLDLNLDIAMSIAKRQQEDDAADREDKYNNEQLLKEFMFQIMQDIACMRMTVDELRANYHKIQSVVELPSSITSDATTVSNTSSASAAASPYKCSITIRGISKDHLKWSKDNPSTELGEGSFGKVYSGKYFDERVAIKYFPNVGKQLRETDLKAVRREAMIMQVAVHHNIIQFKGASFDDGVLVLELASCSLFDAIYRLHATSSVVQLAMSSLESRISVVRDIGSALNCLDFHNIIHRDIKPANILLVEVGGKVIAKVSDFGMSVAIMIGSISSTLKPSSAAKGTAGYHSPEVLRSNPYSTASDMFAFGIVIGELMTGMDPWPGLVPHQIIVQVAYENQRPNLHKWKDSQMGLAYLSGNSEEVRRCDRQLLQLVGENAITEGTCMHYLPDLRPSAERILNVLQIQETNNIDARETEAAARQLWSKGNQIEHQKESLDQCETINYADGR